MNSRERVLTALTRKGPPDKTPFEISWGAFTPLLMKTFLFALSFLLFNCVGTNNQQINNGKDFTWLKENFQNPPSEYGLNCWWWLNFRGRPIAEIPLEPSGLLGPVQIEEAVMN